MGNFIAKQPNGLYCRFSSVVDCPTHYNFTEEDYLNNYTGTVKTREEGQEILKHHVKPFDEVKKCFLTTNMTYGEFQKFLFEVGDV
ncbi:hypothetical protein [Halobacillus litoralis]|uniref:hypothetical protein n=1 Tax=Halobacillus litoralis TaxID=45668 RepID=UPI001CD1D9CB|nr:hypothetical protein [Halobacillus litoralis]MCA1021581.1 hypothetical protein [Halobacillus litoralis]